MADPQDSSPQAPVASHQDHQSPDNSAPSPQGEHQGLPDHPQAEIEGTGDEIADALAAVEGMAEGDTEGTEAPSRESTDRQSESRSKDEEAPAPEPTDRVKPSALASFHRQQKELFQREQQFKSKEAEYARVMGIIENAKSDRLAALELMGFTDTREFLQSIAEDGGRESPERKQLRDLQKWKAQQEQERQEQQRQYQAQQEQHAAQAKVDAIKAEVQNTLKSERYRDSLLALGGTDDNVFAEMDRMATETGEIPPIEEAIKVVEGKYRSYLEEMLTNPEVTRFFQEKLRLTKLSGHGTPQSKTRARPQTIDSAARSPGTQLQRDSDGLDEESVMAEAMKFLSSHG